MNPEFRSALLNGIWWHDKEFTRPQITLPEHKSKFIHVHVPTKLLYIFIFRDYTILTFKYHNDKLY